ncbi:hypothetical protein V1460_18420 [Streptomyces sp. SCSIO 30461]|uniref:hypothetical protein n=1 Tax=Streptomyces sp. SCSIO 30461 TaxID=3118085 RepID=UPI0030D0403C
MRCTASFTARSLDAFLDRSGGDHPRGHKVGPYGHAGGPASTGLLLGGCAARRAAPQSRRVKAAGLGRYTEAVTMSSAAEPRPVFRAGRGLLEDVRAAVLAAVCVLVPLVCEALARHD